MWYDRIVAMGSRCCRFAYVSVVFSALSYWPFIGFGASYRECVARARVAQKKIGEMFPIKNHSCDACS